MELQEKLYKIQQNLKAPKNQFNKFGGYNYRSCEDILEAVKPLLDGCVVIMSDELVQIGERYYVKAEATIALNEERVSVDAYARETDTKKGMDSAQVTGSASSYARKYALNGLFCIEDTKDPDGTNKHGKNGKQESPKQEEPPRQENSNKKKEPLTDKQNARFFALCKKKEWSNDEVNEFREWLKKKEEIEIIEGETPTGKIRTTFTKKGISTVFDDFENYASTWIEEKLNK